MNINLKMSCLNTQTTFPALRPHVELYLKSCKQVSPPCALFKKCDRRVHLSGRLEDGGGGWTKQMASESRPFSKGTGASRNYSVSVDGDRSCLGRARPLASPEMNFK